MDSTDFSTLIERLEREADAHPQLYLGKVAVAAALGFLVPGLIVLVILACCFSILYALVTGATPSILAALCILAGAAAAIATIRALRVQVAVLDGLVLTAEDAPDLFRLIDAISRKIVPAPFAYPIADFYRTDPISRSSAVMAECSALHAAPPEQATGTYG